MHTITINDQHILLLSDTHGLHRNIDIPEGIDTIIHCGDICTDGNIEEILDFMDWYSQLKIPYKIFVNGNHDLPFELEPEENLNLIPNNIIWLNDRLITIKSVRILGISSFPNFDLFTFKNADMLLSHYPPWGIRDDGYGSREILNYVADLKPQYHIFGHNHSDFGVSKIDKTIFINASIFHLVCEAS